MSDIFGEYEPIWQTPIWGNMLVKTGYASESLFFGIIENDILKGFAIGEVRSVGLGMRALFVVGGPNFLKIEDENTYISLKNILAEMMLLGAKQRNLLTILIEPIQNIGIFGNSEVKITF